MNFREKRTLHTDKHPSTIPKSHTSFTSGTCYCMIVKRGRKEGMREIDWRRRNVVVEENDRNTMDATIRRMKRR